MRRSFIKKAGLILLICVSGILYSCRSASAGTEFSFSEDFDGSGEVSAATEVDIKSEDNNEKERQSTDDESTEKQVCVYVCGAVKKSGVYVFEAGERIEAAVLAAGGFGEDADTDALNLADVMSDGQKIYVPAEGETSAGSQEGTASEKGLLNINSASAAELMELPGIGEAKAGQIIAYREANGGFETIDDLKQVPGIKEGVFEPLKDLICTD